MATFTRSSARSALNFTYLDWAELNAQAGARLRAIEQARWALGDLLAQALAAVVMSPELEAALAAEGASWRHLAEGLGVSESLLKRYAYVADAFPRRKRVSGVGWDYHEAVLRALPSASLSNRQKWLREAARHNWSVRQLLTRIRRADGRKKRQAEARVAFAPLGRGKAFAYWASKRQK